MPQELYNGRPFEKICQPAQLCEILDPRGQQLLSHLSTKTTSQAQTVGLWFVLPIRLFLVDTLLAHLNGGIADLVLYDCLSPKRTATILRPMALALTWHICIELLSLGILFPTA